MRLYENRIVVKVGTSMLTNELGKSNLNAFYRLAHVLSDIQNWGYQIILVSSAAIALGYNKLQNKPSNICTKQAAAAIGQCSMLHLYSKFFAEYDTIIGQILLNVEDIEQEEKKNNLTNTFNALLNINIIPIVNGNDSAGYTKSEKKLLGDNDMLSAVITVLCKAKRLIFLSDIKGLYAKASLLYPHIKQNKQINENMYALAEGAGSRRDTGGMKTKIQAANLAAANGANTFIINGKNPEILYEIIKGNSAGTFFPGAASQ